jgi:glycosyltransferase involved in cell wall biosynthesis
MGLPTVPPADSAALAAAVLGVLRSPDGAVQLGAMARARINTELSLEHCVARLVGLYSPSPADVPGGGTTGAEIAR